MAKWIKIEKRLPDTDRQVFALSGTCGYLASYRDSKWWLTYSITLGDVTCWMEVPGEPKDLAYWLRKLKEWWGRRVDQAESASDWLTGWTSRNAQLDRKIVYFANEKTGEIRMGLPEHFPVTPGFHKVVCSNTAEAERWSGRLRQFNLAKEAKTDEQRERIEGPIREEIRKNLHHVMANSRNAINREYVRRYLDRMDSKDRTKMSREEYLHSEAYEKGH